MFRGFFFFFFMLRFGHRNDRKSAVSKGSEFRTYIYLHEKADFLKELDENSVVLCVGPSLGTEASNP
jgi:hypothetical protein